ncbi:HIT family protein [Candidatus Woesearchaeota archaeon]|nr:HIT family protein [Candidatus Woesearchaeota archaeon]
MTCVFCELVQKRANALYEDDKVFVMLSPEPFVQGHVIVLPKHHSPILETVPDAVVADMFKAANKVSTVLFESVGAQGTNVLIQNGPPAGQQHNHAMLHVVPRFENDKLQLGWNPKPASDEDLAKAELLIKEQSKSVGVFEKEKPKPVEQEKPKEIKDDWRVKHLRRIP